MGSLSGLRTVIQVKDRRVGQLDKALQTCRQQLQQQQAALDEARDTAAKCRDEESGLRDGLLGGTSPTGGFRGSDILARQLHLEGAVQRTAVAAKAVQQAEQQAEAAQQQVRAAQQALQRGQHKLDLSRERLSSALLERQQAQDDMQDEEAEEMAVARLLAGTRAAATGSGPVTGEGP